MDKRGHFYIISTLCLLVVTFVFPFAIGSAQETGVVNGTNVNIRSAPSTESNVLGQLHTGDQIEITSIREEWVGFTFNEEDAYIYKDFVTIGTSKVTAPKAADSTPKDTTVTVNGTTLQMPIPPPVVSNRVLVPFRVISESLGIDVKWLPETRQVLAMDGAKRVVFTIDSKTVIIDGNKVTSDPAPFIIEGHTVIPLRLFAESFGAEVGWNAKSKNVTIERNRAMEKIITAETVPLYSLANHSSEVLATLKKGQAVEVLKEFPQWELVRANDLEGFLSKTTPLDKEEGLMGKVKASELNVRSGPTMTSEIIGKLPQGSTIAIAEIIGSWAKISYNQKFGYVSTYYLELTEGGKTFTWLSEPVLQKQVNRDTLTWKKQGTIVTGHRLIANGLEITTNAKQIDAFQGNHPGVGSITYVAGTAGKNIQIKLNQGYHVTVRHSIHEVQVTILPSGLAGKRIVIDPGHGAKDPGATGPSGVKEKEVVLKVALYLEKLVREAGGEPILTRSNNDTFLSLAERVEVPERQGADVFISVHGDSFSETAKGSTTFYHSGKNPSWQQGKQLSDITIKKLTAKLGTTNRGSKDQSLHVIRETKIPAILVELAFLSNPAEEKLLNDPVMQKKAAEALFEALQEFYK